MTLAQRRKNQAKCILADDAAQAAQAAQKGGCVMNTQPPFFGRLQGPLGRQSAKGPKGSSNKAFAPAVSM